MSFLLGRLPLQDCGALMLLLALSGPPETLFGQSGADSVNPATASSALDEQLFRDLEGQRDGLPAKPDSATATAAQRPRDSSSGDLAEQGSTGRWSTIVQQMRVVQRRLQQDDVGQKTLEIQQEIVTQLDRLLQQTAARRRAETVRRQQQAGLSPSVPGQAPAGSPTSPRPTAEPGSQPATTTVPANPPAFELDSTWSHLPAKIREQLRSVAREQFLPDYARQIEAYYRSLSESESSSR